MPSHSRTDPTGLRAATLFLRERHGAEIEASLREAGFGDLAPLLICTFFAALDAAVS